MVSINEWRKRYKEHRKVARVLGTQPLSLSDYYYKYVAPPMVIPVFLKQKVKYERAKNPRVTSAIRR